MQRTLTEKPPVTQRTKGPSDAGLRFLVGIDPGQETGIAVWDEQHRWWTMIETYNFHELMKWAETVSPETRGQMVVVVESAKQLPIYHNKHGQAGKGIKLARSIGENNRECELVIGELKRKGFNVFVFVPASNWQNKNAKWSAADLARQTGYTDRTNEHERDALRFAWTHRHLLRVKGGV